MWFERLAGRALRLNSYLHSWSTIHARGELFLLTIECVCVYTTPPNPVPTRLLPTQSLHLSFQPSHYTAPTNQTLHLSSEHRHYSTLPTRSLHHFSQPSPYAILPCTWFNLDIRCSHYLYFWSATHCSGACGLSFSLLWKTAFVV